MSSWPEEFYSCDWGTTSFRLRRVRLADVAVLEEVSAADGVKVVRERVGGDGKGDEAFARVLCDQLGRMARAKAAAPIQVVISGMASSTVGWCEVPYVWTPFALDGGGLRREVVRLATSPVGPIEVSLVGGVRGVCDMMRGEETEAIGLAACGALRACWERGVLVLPGTHSKHLTLALGRVVGIRTHLTGELLEVLSRHSLLRASVDADGGGDLGEGWREPFVAGVEEALRVGLSGALFAVRARQVLEGVDRASNWWYLSGVAVGGEVAALGREGVPVLVSAGAALAQAYGVALRLAGVSQVAIVPGESGRLAAVHGHVALLRRWLPGGGEV